ncbi:MAG TPA: SRPBCC domain-containing protein [Steroidobacteraceae bacterium]|jgi:uncharacterized protein YndB with AHSA1/START domain
MADILLDLPIRAGPERLFDAVTTPAGLDQWWTLQSSGERRVGAEYRLCFGPDYDWRAKVIRCAPVTDFEFEMSAADSDWVGTRVGFRLTPRGDVTWLRFHHLGWKMPNEHYRISCHCWAMYLRVLRRYLEHGETVPYQSRLDA